MTERVDFKLRHVAVATYRYRHEAELAAGFLDDAGIPYRLQIDDPAMGMTITTPATLWVRSIDLRAAREVLELPDAEISAQDPGPGRSGEEIGAREAETGSASSSPMEREASAPLEIVRVERSSERRRNRMSVRERLIALLIGAGSGAGALLLTEGPGSPILATTLSIVALGFGLVALLGRAPAPVAWLIEALSGSAPRRP